MVDVLAELLHENSTHVFGLGANLVQLVTHLDKLTGREPGSGMRAIRGLHSVLHLGTNYGDTIQDRFIHSSFPGFLQNPDLSLEFAVNRVKTAERLVSGSLDCLSTITLGSTPSEHHVRYALFTWPSLWSWWYTYVSTAKPEWLEMWRKLLTVDLMACFVHAFTQGVANAVSCLTVFLPDVVNPDWRNFIIPGQDKAIYHSEPLAQQAVLHVTGSLTAAILHFLEPTHLDSDGWSLTFINALCGYLCVIVDLEGKGPDDWNHDIVVQSLKTLRRESLADFVSLRQGVCEYAKRSDSESHPGRVDGFNKFFDYV
jgi:hypothetical protein